MADVAVIRVRIDPEDMVRVVRDSLPIEALALELHDVVFAFGKPIPVFSDLQPETRQWFRGRAQMLVDRLLGDDV